MKHLLADRMEKRDHPQRVMDKEVSKAYTCREREKEWVPEIILGVLQSNIRNRVASIHDLAALAAEIPRQRKPLAAGNNETDSGRKEEQEEDDPQGYWSNPETNVLFSNTSGEECATPDSDDGDKGLLVHSDSELQ